ncbi:18 kDa heat shock protein [Clostridium tepidiprofundi DSM 19306]|uniref:18 kDa heat shock protein n=1 Tax=Clostridium tepidiprofundi DSM 19306 TaxID=1121338 RepID=A0A151B2G9_9CLOT|nr:heat shock protein Hsp18 [Clostridium tepidiprofundi]KYH34095.1 18 kDa heat shock protein [Clostridium tepidiprofundi DSM 19306]
MFDMIPYRKNKNLVTRDDMFEQFFNNFFDNSLLEPFNFAKNSFKVDLKENNDNYVVEADLPGVDKNNIDITYENNYLTIRAKREDKIEETKDNYIRHERHYGEFRRSFYIDNVDENNIQASFNNGVLNITLPKLSDDNNKIKRININ